MTSLKGRRGCSSASSTAARSLHSRNGVESYEAAAGFQTLVQATLDIRDCSIGDDDFQTLVQGTLDIHDCSIGDDERQTAEDECL